MINCENISLSFSGQTIFENLTIKIKAGENVCISGSSGKGKSTLLNLFQGYVSPDKGSIKVNGEILNESSIKQIRKNLISVPQNIHIPVKNGVELLDLMELSAELTEVKKFMKKLGLEPEIITKNFSQISGGQKQRLIIAICLSQPKQIILMDEPTSSLDDESIKLLINVVRELKGKTIVSASHNQLWADSTNKIIAL